MKTWAQFAAEGLKITASSSDGAFKITSYIGTRNKRRVYGYFNHVQNRYEETKI